MSKNSKKRSLTAARKGNTGWPVGKAAATKAESKAVAAAGLTAEQLDATRQRKAQEAQQATGQATELAAHKADAATGRTAHTAGQAAACSARQEGRTAPLAQTASAEPASAGTGNGGAVPPHGPSTPASCAPSSPAEGPEHTATAPATEHKADASTGGQPNAAETPAKPQTLMDHLNELRIRLVRCAIAVGLGFLVCWSVVDPIFDALVAPLLAVLPEGSHAIYTTLPEGFFTRMYIAFVAGVFISSPVLFYQIWAFIAPGLYDNEKRYIIPVAIFSAVFFIAGGAFCYIVVFPYAFSFFVSFATESIVAMPKVSDYLGFVLKLILAFGLIFEMPLSAFFLARMGLVTAALMRKVRRYAVLVIFIVAAILTPPDVVSQLLMAGPMLLLYETSILVAAAFGRNKASGQAPAQGKADRQDAEEL